MEVLKYCDLDDIILGYLNKLLVSEKPDQLLESDIKPLPNSEKLTLTDNYKGMALSSIADKLANHVIFNRIRPKINQEWISTKKINYGLYSCII